eukprot:TRINITY_DN26636_c3_g1_i1.p1 TRINITY_DN26636_c3_g1~~TRINITY_DN26636_c3_g1_i1.p1  ORF type:complete len:104 (+),score=6.75 TRINITY_DN26636_c3_g1_i1:32-343(+)
MKVVCINLHVDSLLSLFHHNCHIEVLVSSSSLQKNKTLFIHLTCSIIVSTTKSIAILVTIGCLLGILSDEVSLIYHEKGSKSEIDSGNIEDTAIYGLDSRDFT